jgi:hypothetical protein
MYACECGRKADLFDRWLSILLALFSSASIGAWVFWKEHQTAWAILLGLSQVVSVARPFVPFFKNESKFLGTSYEYDALYSRYKRLWYQLGDNPTDPSISRSLDELGDKENEIEKHSPTFPRVKRWITKVDEAKNQAIRIDFPGTT